MSGSTETDALCVPAPVNVARKVSLLFDDPFLKLGDITIYDRRGLEQTTGYGLHPALENAKSVPRDLVENALLFSPNVGFKGYKTQI